MANHHHIELNDLVVYKENVCLVTNIYNVLGWREFEVTDVISGLQNRAKRQELSFAGAADVLQNFPLDAEMDMTEGLEADVVDEAADVGDVPATTAADMSETTAEVEVPEPEAEPEQTSNDRFRHVSQADLDRLELANTCKSTDNQTKWGVKMFRGAFLLQKIAKYLLK